MRHLVLIAASAAMMIGSTPAFAAPCKDSKTGKFTKCPEKAPAKATRCKGANGKFAKCGRPGARSM